MYALIVITFLLPATPEPGPFTSKGYVLELYEKEDECLSKAYMLNFRLKESHALSSITACLETRKEKP